MEYTGLDRRKHNRVKRPLMAKMRLYQQGQTSQSWDIVQLKNLGAGGLSFNYTEAIALGTTIEFNIMVSTRPEPVHCLGKVCRVDKSSPEGTGTAKKIPIYGIAVHFTK